ncbi:MAG: DMT family transporter [Nitrososphaeria archaeon]
MRAAREALLFLALATFWGLNYPLVKVALASVAPLQLLFLRLAIAIPSLVALLPRSARPPAGLRINLLTALFGALDIVAMQALWYSGESETSPATASIVIYTYPIIVTALGAILLGERVTRGRAAGLLLGFLGTVMIFSGGAGPADSEAYALLLGSAISWSLATIVYRKYLRGEDFSSVNLYHMIYALPMAAALMLWEGPSAAIRWTPFAIAALALIGIPGTALAFTIYVYMYSRHEVSRVAPYMFLVPAFSMVFSYAILGTTASGAELAGYSILSIGIYLSARG